MTATPATITELLAAYRNNSIDCSSFVEAALQRYEATKHINAIVAINPDAVLEQAHAVDTARKDQKELPALAGIPLVLKANIDTVELPTSAATPALDGNIPPLNAPAATHLFTEGALLFGKTNMHELAFGITNNHGAHGAARNPWNTDRIPGGSSGGTAAAIAAGIVPAGLGTDTGGSVRLPAALCGICGFRPTMGRYPGEGIVPISHTRDTTGAMARSVSDLILLDSVLAQKPNQADIEIKGLRLGVPRDYYYDNLEPGVAQVVESILSICSDMGMELVELDMPGVEELNNNTGFPVALYEARRDLANYLKQSAPSLRIEDVVAEICSPDVKQAYAAVMSDDTIPEEVYQQALQITRPQLQQTFADYFSNNSLDAMIIPTTPVTAPPIGDDETIELNGERLPTMGTIIRCTDPSSNAGIPSLSVAAGIADNGLPVGVCLEGPVQTDANLLAIGKQLQEQIGILPLPEISS